MLEEVVSDEVVVVDETTSDVLDTKLAGAALVDAALAASEPVRESMKDDRPVSESEEDEVESDNPRSADRLERASVSDRLFCCDEMVDVRSEVMVSLLDEGSEVELKAVVVTLINDLLTSRGKYILGLATGSALTSVAAASAVTKSDFVCILQIESLRHTCQFSENCLW